MIDFGESPVAKDFGEASIAKLFYNPRFFFFADFVGNELFDLKIYIGRESI